MSTQVRRVNVHFYQKKGGVPFLRKSVRHDTIKIQRNKLNIIGGKYTLHSWHALSTYYEHINLPIKRLCIVPFRKM